MQGLLSENPARLVAPDRDSEAYGHIGKHCIFCSDVIEKRDITPPRCVKYNHMTGYVGHGDCVDYVVRKYPNVPIRALEGKLIRYRVDSHSGPAA